MPDQVVPTTLAPYTSAVAAPPAATVKVAATERWRTVLERADTLERARLYITRLLRGLDVPLEPVFELEAADVLPPAGAHIQLTIAGEPVVIWTVHDTDTDASAAITECLERCRTRFIDDATMRLVWLGWFPRRGAYLDDARFAAALLHLGKSLVTLGMKLGRTRSTVEAWLPGEVGPETARSLVERVLATTETVGVGLILSAEQHARATTPPPGQLAPVLDLMGDGFFYELGLAPRVHDPQIDEALRAPWFAIRWNDVTTPPIKGLASDEFLANDTAQGMSFTGVQAVRAINPANNAEAAIASGADAKAVVEGIGVTTWDADGYMVLHASAVIRRHAGAFITTDTTRAYEANLADAFPDLVRETGARLNGRELTRMLRLLLDEQISIRDLRTIFDAVLAINGVTTADYSTQIVFTPNTGFQCPVSPGRTIADLGPADYCDCVRVALQHQISHQHTRAASSLLVYLVEQDVEACLRTQPVPSAYRRKFLDALGAEAGDGATGGTPCLLTTHELRRAMREIVADEFPRLAVLSYQELSPALNIQPVARISIDS